MIFHPLRTGHNVNCRIGSLEMHRKIVHYRANVNCRIGSLENLWLSPPFPTKVNCRIGSLEILRIAIECDGYS